MGQPKIGIVGKNVDFDGEGQQMPETTTPGSRSAAGWTGAFFAVGAAIFIAATAPFSVPVAVTVAAVGVGVAGAGTSVVAAGLEANVDSGEGAAKDLQQKTVGGLIEKGNAKSGESRDEYFDKLEELYPGQKDTIRKARSAQAPKSEDAKGDGEAQTTSSGAKEGTASSSETPVVQGEEVKSGSATLSGDARE